MLNTIPDPACIVDAKGTFLAVNHRLEEVAGFKKEEWLGKNFQIITVITAKTKAILSENLAKRMKGMRIAPYEIETFAKDGKKFVFEVNGKGIEYEGKPADLVLFRDITERKKMEEDIRNLATLRSENPNPVLRVSQDGAILLANDASGALLRKWGCKIGDKVPKFWRDLIAEVFTSQSDRSVDVEIGEKYYAFYVRSVKDAGYINLYGRDITERKQMEKELRESEENFRALAENAFDCILIACGGVHVYANKRAAEMLGYTIDELLKTSIKDLVHPKEFKKIEERYKRRLEEKRVPSQYETVAIRKDGKSIPIELTITKTMWKQQPTEMIFFRDITERKRAEESLKESEEKYRVLVENSPNLVAIYQDGVFKYANKAMCERLGWTFEEMASPSFNPIEKIVPQRFQALIKEKIAKRLSGAHIPPYELNVKTRDGLEIPVIVEAGIILYNGKPADEIIFVDASERKQMENELKRYSEHLERLVEARTEKLRKSEEKFRRIYNAAINAIYATSLEGKILDINPAGVSMFGFDSLDELRKVNVTNRYVNPDDRRRLIELVSKGPVKDFETKLEKKDGEIFDAIINSYPIKDEKGKVIGLQGAIIDITERKKLEEALRETETRFRSIAERSFDPIFELNLDGHVTYCSPATERIFGRRPEEIVGKLFQDFLPESELPKIAQALTELIKGKNVEGIQTTALRKDGSLTYVEVNVSPIFRDGTVIGVQGIVRDITERKKWEEVLRESERLATIGEAAAMVGHDLRNPLQTIVTIISLLKQLLEPIFPRLRSEEKQDIEELAETVEEQVTYMDKIVSDLQDYSQPMTPELVETDLRILFNGIISTMRIPETVKVSIAIEKDFPKLMVDPILMRRMFTNLMINALQAMPEGGKLTIRASKEGETASISFQDTGVGIPEENLDKLFTPLFTTKAKGQGLGLAVCKRIVEAHGGTIVIKSKVGEGSTFTVKIPMVLARN